MYFTILYNKSLFLSTFKCNCINTFRRGVAKGKIMGTRIQGKQNIKFTKAEIRDLCIKYNIELLDDEYIGNNYHHSWFCKKHKKEQVQRLDKIQRSGELKCCSHAKNLASNKQELSEIEKELNITLLSEYFSNNIPLTWKCNTHDEYFKKSLQTIRKNPQPHCCKREEKLKMVKTVVEPLGYILLDDEYIGTTHTWYCIHHNRTYYNRRTTYNDFARGQLLKCCANEKNSGKNHPNYTHNVTDEQRVNDRRSQKNKIWRQEVIKRDDLTCQRCGISGTKIVAHHLENYLENPSLRYDPRNGITLCVPCHKEFHSKYGKGRTTKIQTEEWINGY